MKAFCIVLAICSAVVMLDALLIESKLDATVFTVSTANVPTDRYNKRLGVMLRRARHNDSSLRQQWDVEEYATFGYKITSRSKYDWNAVSVGLAFNDGYGYYYTYNIGNVTADNFRLLETNNVLDGSNFCVKNPGNGSFHLEVECDINDEGQLWRFVQ